MFVSLFQKRFLYSICMWFHSVLYFAANFLEAVISSWISSAFFLVLTHQFQLLVQPFDLSCWFDHWCRPADWPIDLLVQPLPCLVTWSPRSTCPGWWTVSLMSLKCTTIHDILPIFMNVTETCFIIPMLEPGGWLYLYWYYYYAQSCCTKLAIANEYCWYNEVFGNWAAFPD